MPIANNSRVKRAEMDEHFKKKFDELHEKGSEEFGLEWVEMNRLVANSVNGEYDIYNDKRIQYLLSKISYRILASGKFSDLRKENLKLKKQINNMIL